MYFLKELFKRKPVVSTELKRLAERALNMYNGGSLMSRELDAEFIDGSNGYTGLTKEGVLYACPLGVLSYLKSERMLERSETHEIHTILNISREQATHIELCYEGCRIGNYAEQKPVSIDVRGTRSERLPAILKNIVRNGEFNMPEFLKEFSTKN